MKWALSLILASAASAGPIDFGLAELNSAIAARKLNIKIKTEFNVEQPETYRIYPVSSVYARITGGDIRGLMYGLLEAADQVRTKGKLIETHGVPETRMRGIRIFLHNEDLEKNWYYSEDYWLAYFQMLARDRFNRFNLVFAHQTAYLAPPYPFLVDVPEFPSIRPKQPVDRERNLKMLRFISQTASEYGIDFTLGVWEHNIQPAMTPSVDGLTRQNIGPYSYAALRQILEACPQIRSVQMRTNSESGIPPDQQVEFYRDYAFKALHDVGRMVTLDLRGWLMQSGLKEAAESAGVPLRISSKYWAEDLGRPYQPAETWPGYSYLNFLEKPRHYDFYWELWGLGSHRMLLWGDPDYVKRAVSTFALGGGIGFEIDPPLAQMGFGNHPGVWKIETEPGHWNFERYSVFYTLWGRLSYDPKTTLPLIEHLDEYRAASQVLNQIVAAHLADPNMYIWPEINPGGLIDAYIDVKPSDFRMIASIPEAVSNRLTRTASAKQTPLDTAALLEGYAARLAKTEILDFKVLAHLARYHARKQRAAYFLELFYRTQDEASLDAAESELKEGLAIWESLVKTTEDKFPPNMAFGPDDVGSWKDKLPYVRHDLETIAQRRRAWNEFRGTLFRFDFGAPVETPRPYRKDPYVVNNSVEFGFTAVSANTKYTDELGYGWSADGERVDVPLPLTPYAEVRATAKNPAHLPGDVLRSDSIRGSGSNTFRVKTGPGVFNCVFIPTTGPISLFVEAKDGVVDIPFPQTEWTLAGMVIRQAKLPIDHIGQEVSTAIALPPLPTPLPRPQFIHKAPDSAPPNQQLTLNLRIQPAKDATVVRLHYRPLNALEKFKTIEKPAEASVTFAIPASDISPNWDLLYYFEILNRESSGWFELDPLIVTSYHVIKIAAPQP